MAYMLVREAVGDYNKWKAVFDACADERRNAGCKGGFVFQNISDRREVVVLLQFDDLARMKQFMDSDELRELRAQAGSTGELSADVLDLVFSQPS